MENKKPKNQPLFDSAHFYLHNAILWNIFIFLNNICNHFIISGCISKGFSTSLRWVLVFCIKHIHNSILLHWLNLICSRTSDNTCTFTINIEEKLEKPVYVYYRLENFYSNHRNFVKARSFSQLRGEVNIKSNSSGFWRI